MIAKAECPECKSIIQTDCWGCITGNTLVHQHIADENPDIYENIEWKVIEE